MDAPNAPIPANSNTQDQNADAVQDPANQVQGPMVQNQAQVPTGQIPAQIPAVTVQGSMQVSLNLPVQPPPQPVPIQLVPAGMVVPAPR